MTFRWIKLCLSASLLIVGLILVLKLTTGSAFAASNLGGDVSHGCPSGCQAVTNNPQSFYSIWSNTAGSVMLTIQYTCTSGQEGFDIVMQNGGDNLTNTNHDDICVGAATGSGGTITSQFDVTGQPDPNNGYYPTIIEIQGVKQGTGGHLTFNIAVSGTATEPDISYSNNTFGHDAPTNQGQGQADWPPVSSNTPSGYQFGDFAASNTFTFSPACNYDSGPAYIAWSGVDYGSSYQNNNIQFVLTNQTTGQTLVTKSKAELGPDGNSNMYYAEFNAVAGDVYNWSWTNESGQNEIVYSIPFTSNSVDKGVQCFKLNYNTTVNSQTLTNTTSNATFENSITNSSNSPDNASYFWSINGQYVKNGDNVVESNFGNIGLNYLGEADGVQPGNSKPDKTNTYNFPATAQSGDRYCEEVASNNSTGIGNNPGNQPVGGNSPYKCVTYKPGGGGGCTSNCNPNPGVVTPRGAVTNATCSATAQYGIDTGYPTSYPINYQLYIRNNRNNTTANGGLNTGYMVTRIATGQFPSSAATTIAPAGLQNYFLAHQSGNDQYTLDFYLRIQDPHDGKWYWVSSGSDVASTVADPITVNNANGPDNIYQHAALNMPFTEGCGPYTPIGYLNGASCTVDGDAPGATWGWVENQQDPSQPVTVYVKYQTSANPGVTYDYTAGSPDGQDYSASGNLPGLPANHAFAIPVSQDANAPIGSATPDLLDGYTYTFYVYALGANQATYYGLPDAAGTPGVTYKGTGYGQVMTSCSRFAVTDTSSDSLSPDDESASSYSTTASVNVGYDDGLDPATYNTNFSPTGGLVMGGCSLTDYMLRGAASTLLPVTAGSTANPYNCAASQTTYQKGTTPIQPAGNPYGPTIDTPIQPGDQYCPYMSTSYGTGTNIIDANGNVLYSAGPTTNLKGVCAVVDDKPFFKVFGSGIKSVGDFQTCSGAGVLDGWNNDNGTFANYDFGSSAQYQALSLGSITGVASGISQEGSYSRPASQLSFANDNNVNNNGTYNPALGGNYADTACPVSISEDQAKIVGQYTSNEAFDGLSSGEYTAGSTTAPENVTIGGGTIGGDSGTSNGQSIAIFVDGNVQINGPITYNTTGWSTTTTAPYTNVPSFTLVATGNIYIAPGVQQLDGTYISNDANGDGGTIYTCGTTFGPESTEDQFGVCNHQLEVTGQFEANNVQLMRTFGSLRDETPQSNTTSTPNNDGSTLFQQEDCAAGNGPPYEHFYQVAGVAMQPAAGTTGCSDYSGSDQAAYILPLSNNSQPKTEELYFFARNGPGDNYYTTLSPGQTPEEVQTYIQTLDQVKYPGSTVNTGVPVGYVVTPPDPRASDGGCTGYNYTDTADYSYPVVPLYKMYNENYNYYTTNINEDTGLQVQVVGCVFKESGDAPTITQQQATNPPVLRGCSNEVDSSYWIDQATCAAEVFNFSPELYLGTPPAQTELEAGGGSDSITSLPPVF
jgi:hypothetical protein